MKRDHFKGLKSQRGRRGLRRGFAVVLTAALLASNFAFAPVPAEAVEEGGMSQHYIFRPAETVPENDAQLGSNILIGDNILRDESGNAYVMEKQSDGTEKKVIVAKRVHTDGWMATEDGTQRITTYYLSGGTGTGGNGVKSDLADHYGVPYRLISKQNDDETTEDTDGNGSGEEGEAVKAPTETLQVYVDGMDDLDTTGLAAVNLSLLYGFFAPNHNAAEQSNQSNVAVEKTLRVFVSVDGENWLPGSVGIRSSKLVGGGSQSVKDGWPATFYRIETEDLLNISGVAGKTIKNIMIMPYGESLRVFGRFAVSELAVNTYDTEYAFNKLVPADALTYTDVGGDTLRQIAVEEAVRTATTKWTTDKRVYTKFSGKSCIYWPTMAWDLSAPIVHQGPAYEQNLDSTRELFKSQITDVNEQTGIGHWNGGYEQSLEGNDAVFGMDCQTFVFNAVSRVSRSYAWSCANTVIAPGSSLVGPHLNVTFMPYHTDKDILDPSDAQAVYESYALADAGDITDSYGYGLGHTRLVKSSHAVYIPEDGGYFNQVSAPEYAPVTEGEGEYILLGDFEPKNGGGYTKKDVYVYVGAGNGDYNDHQYVATAANKGNYKLTSEGLVWAGEGKGNLNKVYGYVEVGEGSGSYIKADKYVWAGEGKGEYAMVEGEYYRMPKVNGHRRGDYTRVKEGVYKWVGEGNGTYIIDPDQSSVVCVHQASIPKYFFKHPTTGDIQSVFVYKMSDYPESKYYVSWEDTETGERSEIVDPPLIVEGYELMYSCSSRDNDEFSFAKLRDTGYAVFTMDEYKSGKVEDVDVQAVLGSQTIGQSFVDGGATLAVSSNYRLISYEIDLLDETGALLKDENDATVYSTGPQFIMESNIMTQTFSSSALNKALAALPDGKYQLRLSVDSGPFTELGQDTVPNTEKTFAFEIEGRTHAQLSDGDVVYIPSACSAGQTVQAYVINSTNNEYAVGDAIMVTMPDDSAINGTDGATRAHFWQMVGSTGDNGSETLTLYRIRGMFGDESGSGVSRFKFGYHDVITDIVDNTLCVANADGHMGSGSNCGYYFTHSCGWDGVTSNGGNKNGVECASTLAFDNNLKILDLRTDVILGKTEAAATLSEVRTLTDTGLAVINIYAQNGSGPSGSANLRTKATGTASVVLVIDPSRYFTADYPVAVEEVEGGTIQLNRTSGAAGDLVTVNVATAEGYVLEEILVDGTPIAGDTFAISGLHTVSVRLEQYANVVTVEQAVGGTVSTDKRGGEDGDTITVTATPSENYVLKAILVNGEELNGTQQFALNGNATVTAQFARVVQPGDVMYFPGDPVGLEYVEGYLVSSDTPDNKIFFYFEGGFAGN